MVVRSLGGFRARGTLQGTGRGAVRLARLLWEQEVAGSNPVAPSRLRRIGQVIKCGGKHNDTLRV